MPPAEPPTLSDKELDDMETLELEEEEELDASFGLNTGLYPPRPRGSCARVRPLGIPGAGGLLLGMAWGRVGGAGSWDMAWGPRMSHKVSQPQTPSMGVGCGANPWDPPQSPLPHCPL